MMFVNDPCIHPSIHLSIHVFISTTNQPTTHLQWKITCSCSPDCCRRRPKCGGLTQTKMVRTPGVGLVARVSSACDMYIPILSDIYKQVEYTTILVCCEYKSEKRKNLSPSIMWIPWTLSRQCGGRICLGGALLYKVSSLTINSNTHSRFY